MHDSSSGKGRAVFWVPAIAIVAIGAFVFLTLEEPSSYDDVAPDAPPATSPTSAATPDDAVSGEAPPPSAQPVDFAALDDPRARECEAGDAQACHGLASTIAFDAEGPSELQLSLELLKRACELELAEACQDLGIIYEEGAGVELDPELAQNFYQRACELGEERGCVDARSVASEGGFEAYGPRWQEDCEEGDANACLDLAVALQHTEELNDAERSRALLERACELDAPEGCLRLAQLREDEGLPTAEVEALIARACDTAYGPACTTLAQRLTDADAEPARIDALYAQACELDDVNGCAEHALRLAKQDDLAGARTLWKEGCERWHGYSCFHHARSFLDTSSGPDANPEMIFGFERACTLNVPVACYNLGIFYNTRQPSPDFARGREFLSRGCELGHTQACTFAAQMLASGQGGPVDATGAGDALQRACELGDSAACARAQP